MLRSRCEPRSSTRSGWIGDITLLDYMSNVCILAVRSDDLNIAGQQLACLIMYVGQRRSKNAPRMRETVRRESIHGSKDERGDDTKWQRWDNVPSSMAACSPRRSSSRRRRARQKHTETQMRDVVVGCSAIMWPFGRYRDVPLDRQWRADVSTEQCATRPPERRALPARRWSDTDAHDCLSDRDEGMNTWSPIWVRKLECAPIVRL